MADLPTGNVAAVADAVTSVFSYESQMQAYANTPAMLAAHIAQLNAPQINGQPGTGAGNAPAPNIVGRIANASEGSVSVSTQLDLPPGSSQWFAQTKYGLAYWQATAAYRTMRYIPGPYRAFTPWPYG